MYEGIRVYASIDGNIEGATELGFIPRHYQVDNEYVPAENAEGWYTYKLPIFQSGNTYIILRGENYGGFTSMDNIVVKECNIPVTTFERTINASELPYTWDGIVFDEAGTIDTFLIAANGCDSVVVRTLNVNHTATITATANPTEGGSVEGTGSYDYGTEITLTATPNTGYTFVEWNDGITENPRNVTVSRDSNFVANFATNTYTLTYMDGNDVLGEQTYAFGATVTPIAEPTKEGYTFTGWNPAVPATMPAENVTVYAQWQVNSYTVTATANPTEGGIVEGTADNDVFVNGTAYNYGTRIRLIAQVNTGYQFVNWTINDSVVSTRPAH